MVTPKVMGIPTANGNSKGLGIRRKPLTTLSPAPTVWLRAFGHIPICPISNTQVQPHAYVHQQPHLASTIYYEAFLLQAEHLRI